MVYQSQEAPRAARGKMWTIAILCCFFISAQADKDPLDNFQPTYGQDLLPSYSELDEAASAMDPIDMLRMAVPGTPGEDYPILGEVPDTAFDCTGRVEGGYYADTEAECQPFHICTNDGNGGMSKYSFLCPNGTLFNQQYFICEYWFNVDCSLAESLYGLNDAIGTVEGGNEDAAAAASEASQAGYKAANARAARTRSGKAAKNRELPASPTRFIQTKESRDSRNGREGNDVGEGREGREGGNSKDGRVSRDGRNKKQNISIRNSQLNTSNRGNQQINQQNAKQNLQNRETQNESVQQDSQQLLRNRNSQQNDRNKNKQNTVESRSSPKNKNNRNPVSSSNQLNKDQQNLKNRGNLKNDFRSQEKKGVATVAAGLTQPIFNKLSKSRSSPAFSNSIKTSFVSGKSSRGSFSSSASSQNSIQDQTPNTRESKNKNQALRTIGLKSSQKSQRHQFNGLQQEENRIGRQDFGSSSYSAPAPLSSYAATDTFDTEQSSEEEQNEYYDDYDPNDIPADQAADPVAYEEAPLPVYSKSDPNADPSPPSSDYSLASDDYDDYDPNDVPADQAANPAPLLPTPNPDPVLGGYEDPSVDLLPEYFKSEIALGLADRDDVPLVDPYTGAASQNIPTRKLPPPISLQDYNVPDISDVGFSDLASGSYGR